MEEQLDYALSKIEALEERIELLEQQLPQQEISDEEIEKFADEELGTIKTDFDFGVIQGMKWYREQLKCKGNDSKSKN